jgi:hypothetical protein
MGELVEAFYYKMDLSPIIAYARLSSLGEIANTTFLISQYAIEFVNMKNYS